MYFPKCGGRSARASHWLRLHDPWCGSRPLTFLHNPEPHFTNCAVNVRWVLHLAGERPVVGGLQIPDNDGSIIPLNVPVPGDSLFKPPSRQLVGLLQVTKYLQGRGSCHPSAVCVTEAARGSGAAPFSTGLGWGEPRWPSRSRMNSEAVPGWYPVCFSCACPYPLLERLQPLG